MRRFRKLRGPLNGLLVIILSILFGLVVSWIADFSQPDNQGTLVFVDAELSRTTYLLILFPLAILLALATFRIAGWLLPVRQLSYNKTRPSKGLILLLSTSKPIIANYTDGIFGNPIEFEGDQKIILSGDPNHDLEMLEDAKIRKLRWNYQQMIRAIKPHLMGNSLQRVILVGSRDSKDPKTGATTGGSNKEFAFARALINAYAEKRGQKISIECMQEVDFEDIEEILLTLSGAVKKLANASGAFAGLSTRDILIDVTGGTKAASIAGAISTLNNRVRFQYVSTEEIQSGNVQEMDFADGFVHTYDVEIQTFDRPV